MNMIQNVGIDSTGHVFYFFAFGQETYNTCVFFFTLDNTMLICEAGKESYYN